MKIIYSPEYDMAYIELKDIAPGEAASHYRFMHEGGTLGEINLEFDSKGLLIGIEVAEASQKLHPDTLTAAEIKKVA